MARSRGVRARKARAFKIGPAPCRYGSNCWRPGCVFNHGDCPERTAQVSALADFWRSQSARESTDQESQVRSDISQLRGAVCKLAAKIMWNSAISDTSNPVHRQSDGHSVVEYAMENPTVSEQVVVSKIPEVPSMERIQEQIVESIKEVPQERVQQRTVEQNVCMSVPTVQEQMNVQVIPGAQVVERIQKQIAETIPQERDQRTVEQNVCMSVPTVQEQTIVQEIPGTQVVERIQKQIAETIPQERVQRTVEQNVRTSVPTPAQMPKSLDRWLRASELQKEEAYWNEYFDQEDIDQLRQEWLMGAFEPQYYDDGRRERKSLKKKKKNLNRTVQVMERIPEHTVESSDQEELDQLRHDWWTG